MKLEINKVIEQGRYEIYISLDQVIMIWLRLNWTAKGWLGETNLCSMNFSYVLISLLFLKKKTWLITKYNPAYCMYTFLWATIEQNAFVSFNIAVVLPDSHPDSWETLSFFAGSWKAPSCCWPLSFSPCQWAGETTIQRWDSHGAKSYCLWPWYRERCIWLMLSQINFFFQKFSFELIKLLSLCWRPEVVQSHVSWVEMYKAVQDTVVRISRMEERELKPSTWSCNPHCSCPWGSNVSVVLLVDSLRSAAIRNDKGLRSPSFLNGLWFTDAEQCFDSQKSWTTHR